RRDKRLQRSPRDAVAAFALLVRIGRGAEGNGLAFPNPTQLLREQFGEVDLHVDLAIEAGTGVASAAGVIVACVAIHAGPLASVIGVEAPGEGHALHARECALHRDLAVDDAAPHGCRYDRTSVLSGESRGDEEENPDSRSDASRDYLVRRGTNRLCEPENRLDGTEHGHREAKNHA